MAWAAVPVVLGDRFLGQHEKILDKIIAAVAMRNRRDALEAHLKALAEYPPPAEYAGRHQHPALVVSGSQDTLVAPRSAALLAELCRGRWSPVEGAGHTVPVEDPETFNRRVKAFFFRHPSTDRP
jgi:pimeloyl-ACP methyl ester carboxylesterase